jgi:hypothetical protein
MEFWRQYLDGLNALRDERGMTIVQIAHTDIKRFDSPEHDPYDRYVIKLHTRAAALLQEHADIVLFANYRISTVKADVGFNKKVNRALGSGERVIHTAERPGLPGQEPLRPARQLAARLVGLRAGDAGQPEDRSHQPLNSPFLTAKEKHHGFIRTHLRRLHRRTHRTLRSLSAGQVPGPGRRQRNAPDQGRHGAIPAPRTRHPRRAVHRAQDCSTASTSSTANPDAVLMAQRSLSALCRAAGKMQVSNSEQLHLIPVQIDVKVRPPKGQYGESNSIRYLSGSDAQPTSPAPVAAATAGFARAASPAAQSTLPWKRQG